MIILIWPVLQLERGSRSCVSGVLWESRSGSWWMRWEPVAHPEDDLFWGDKLLPVPHVLSQVVVEQKACARCSGLLQTIWDPVYFRSFCGIASTWKIFFPLTNSRLQIFLQELKYLVEKDLQPQKAWLCLSPWQQVWYLPEQSLIKSKALLTNCFWLASVPFFVLSMPCPVSLLQLNRKLITVL